MRFNQHTIVNENQVNLVIKAFNDELEVTSFSLLEEGLSTSNYHVKTSNNESYLLRIYPLNSPNYESELNNYKYASSVARVPELYFFDNSQEVLDNPFIIMEYIDGVTLKKYLASNENLPSEIVYDIAFNLGSLHQKKYQEMALLGHNLAPVKSLVPVAQLHSHYLKSTAGAHLDSDVVKRLVNFIDNHKSFLMSLEDNYSFSHGDFTFTNIMIDLNNKAWFIDFEYSLSAPIFYDIGKFFRKIDLLESLGGKRVVEIFKEGYQKSSNLDLPSDWFELSIFLDITSMLQIINNENAYKPWIEAVNRDINKILDRLESNLRST